MASTDRCDASAPSSTRAAVIRASPAIGKRLYRPVLAMLRPDRVVDRVTPPIMGTSSNPAFVALTPAAAWRNTGTNTVTAKSDAVARKRAALAMATTGVPSSHSGTIGSAVRRSRATRRPDNTSIVLTRTTIGAEPQG